MNDLMHNAAALAALEISVTNTRQPCPTHNVTTEWIKLKATEREAVIRLVDECAGVVSFNTAKEVKSFTLSLAYVCRTIQQSG